MAKPMILQSLFGRPSGSQSYAFPYSSKVARLTLPALLLPIPGLFSEIISAPLRDYLCEGVVLRPFGLHAEVHAEAA
jgi:hypothetical protein